MTRSTAPRAVGWLAVAGLITAAVISPAATMAATVVPVAHEGNITSCPEGYVKIFIDGPSENTATDQGSSQGVTVNVAYSNHQTTIDFTVSGGVVNIAYVKGGNGYNTYNYGPAGTTGDTGLVSPLNGGNELPIVSHSIFCATAGTTTTTTTTDGTTTAQTTTADTTTADTTTADTTTAETTTADTTTADTTTADTTTADTTTADTTTAETTTADTTTADTTTADTTTAETTTADTTTADTTTAETTTADTTTADTTTADTTTAAAPSGSVLGETGQPQITPPPTDSISRTSAPTNGSWRLLLVAIAGLLGGLLILTPATARNRR